MAEGGTGGGTRMYLQRTKTEARRGNAYVGERKGVEWTKYMREGLHHVRP